MVLHIYCRKYLKIPLNHRSWEALFISFEQSTCFGMQFKEDIPIHPPFKLNNDCIGENTVNYCEGVKVEASRWIKA